MPLFDATDFGQLKQRRVEGFTAPIPAICYRGVDLKSPFPMGGIATGYLELRSDGKLGLTSIFNSYVPMMPASGTLLTLIDKGGKEHPLDVEHADISVLAHFPVCNMRFAVKDGPVVWLRVFGTMLPGDAETSNTPGMVMEVTVDDAHFEGQVRFNIMALDHHVEPVVKPLDLPTELTGVGRQYFKGRDYRGSFVLSWIDGGEGKGAASADKADFTLTGPIVSGKTRRAVFCWHFPWWIDSGGEPHMNRYASRFVDALEVAQFLRTNHASLLQRTLAWQDAIYRSGQPDWIANALVQSLYSYAKNTVWVDEHRPDRWYEPNGFFVHSESFRGCPIVETMVCRQHGHLATLMLWPDLEKSTLAAFAHFQLRDGEIPFSFGQPTSLRDPRYHCQHPLNSSQFVQMLYQYLIRTGDEVFIKHLWPNAVGAMHYAMSLDSDNDGLINDHAHALAGDNWPANQFYDQWPWHGTSCYVAGIGLASLCTFATTADMLGHHEEHEWAMKLYTLGATSFRDKLWTGSYFRLWHDEKLGNNDTCLANQLMGQWCCRIAGLAPLVDDVTCRNVYESIDKLNASPTKFGLINGGNFQGDPSVAGDPNNNHGTMIFVGENLCAAMTGMYEGYAPAEEWARRLVWTIHEHQSMPFDQYCLIRHDNGAPAWGNDYYSNLVVWALPMARQRVGLKEHVCSGGLIDNILSAGRKPA